MFRSTPGWILSQVRCRWNLRYDLLTLSASYPEWLYMLAIGRHAMNTNLESLSLSGVVGQTQLELILMLGIVAPLYFLTMPVMQDSSIQH